MRALDLFAERGASRRLEINGCQRELSAPGRGSDAAEQIQAVRRQLRHGERFGAPAVRVIDVALRQPAGPHQFVDAWPKRRDGGAAQGIVRLHGTTGGRSGRVHGQTAHGRISVAMMEWGPLDV